MFKPVTRFKTFGIVCLGLLWLSLEGCGWAQDRDYGNLLKNQLKYPKDLQITLFAEAPKARHMAFDDGGVMFLSQTKAGKVVALPDADGDGTADRAVSIMEGGNGPHGLAFLQLDSGYYLYIAEEHRVVRLKRTAKPFTFGEPEVIVSGIPTGGHSTRTIKFKDGKLYLSVGSSCNVCIEDHRWRAAIIRFDVDGKNEEIFAHGLRNSVGIEFSPYSGELWGVNNGRDWLGDDHPREELNIIRQGKHYGWPYCYEDRVSDPDFGARYDCERTELPAHTFTAHMAPLGLEFYQDGTLPARYRNSVFIAFHGSWNRSVPAGYQVRRLQLDAEGNIQSDEVFIEGWLEKDGSKAGRPVDAAVSPKGDLYISDDYLGVVYRVTGK
ncbi:PQQ-dependent sugar dehydrogenase [Nitrospina watsonii]|uniref:Oxidoreductase n=1 Tax=Nitrospina watsonii TaxID=1323948 RepID=A0ABN8VYG8_9BACT|nr:PQQ-dependent sugar dehydrogenase [Nitrospina watsonii]CAI2717193.1 Putative oxidoreductase [Nitrospina watsonii]